MVTEGSPSVTSLESSLDILVDTSNGGWKFSLPQGISLVATPGGSLQKPHENDTGCLDSYKVAKGKVIFYFTCCKFPLLIP